MNHRKQWIKVVLTVFISISLLLPGSFLAAAETGQRDAKSRNGMVASAHPLASKVGVDILKAGGNAVDAAVAVGFALGVVEPNASGLGGGGFMLIRFAETGEMAFIDFREKAPGKSTPDMYPLTEQGKPALDHRGLKPSVVGGLAVGVPGEVAGLLTALEKYGTMDRKQVMAPAIAQARKGITVSAVLADLIQKEMESLAPFEASRKLYFKDDLPKVEGDTVQNLDLAATLETIALKGKDGFYKGDIAKKIADAVQKDGGIITTEDLANYDVSFREPVTGTYRGYEIISAPPASSGGTHVIELLNILEYFNMKALGFNTPESCHIWAEAMKLMYADRAAFMADTDFIKVPLGGLTSKEYARSQFARINLAAPTSVTESGDPWGYESGSTSHFSIVDSKGNMVAATKTINHFFGSGITVPGTGILLNDEMDDFSLKPGNANSIEPGKKPLSSMSPTLIMKDGKSFATLGTPGGKRIITTVAQMISNLVDYGMDIQEAIDAPRTNHYQEGKLKIESRIPESVQKALEAKGHILDVMQPFDLYFGGAQGITIDPVTGELHGGADPRRDGQAMGY